MDYDLGSFVAETLGEKAKGRWDLAEVTLALPGGMGWGVRVLGTVGGFSRPVFFVRNFGQKQRECTQCVFEERAVVVQACISDGDCPGWWYSVSTWTMGAVAGPTAAQDPVSLPVEKGLWVCAGCLFT